MLDLHAANLRTVWTKAAAPGIAPRHVATFAAHRRRLLVLAVEVSRAYGLTVEDFKSPTRVRDVSWPRQEFMLAAHRAGYSLGQIARFLNRDHTTILHGIRAASKREAGE